MLYCGYYDYYGNYSCKQEINVMKPDDIARYLKQVYHKEITITGTGKLGETDDGLKEFGRPCEQRVALVTITSLIGRRF